jgi:hypothetical protein
MSHVCMIVADLDEITLYMSEHSHIYLACVSDCVP